MQKAEAQRQHRYAQEVSGDGTTLTVQDCASSGSVTANGGFTGGIAGFAENLTLNNCLSTATLPIAANETAFDGPCPGTVNALLANDGDGNSADDGSGNSDNESLWSTDTVGCTTTGCATSGFPTDGTASAGETTAQLINASYTSNYPTTWDFTTIWNPPNGTDPATLR